MQVRHIDHIQLAMPGGCDDEAREPSKVHLGVEQDFVPARKAHPALVAEGLRELAAGLQRAGYHVGIPCIERPAPWRGLTGFMSMIPEPKR
jgi:hypothetical protein